MWAIGRYETIRMPVSGPASARASTASAAAHTLAWVMATALGGPVVPDVKITVAMSSGRERAAAAARSIGALAAMSAHERPALAGPGLMTTTWRPGVCCRAR